MRSHPEILRVRILTWVWKEGDTIQSIIGFDMYLWKDWGRDAAVLLKTLSTRELRENLVHRLHQTPYEQTQPISDRPRSRSDHSRYPAVTGQWEAWSGGRHSFQPPPNAPSWASAWKPKMVIFSFAARVQDTFRVNKPDTLPQYLAGRSVVVILLQSRLKSWITNSAFSASFGVSVARLAAAHEATALRVSRNKAQGSLCWCGPHRLMPATHYPTPAFPCTQTLSHRERFLNLNEILPQRDNLSQVTGSSWSSTLNVFLFEKKGYKN